MNKVIYTKIKCYRCQEILSINRFVVKDKKTRLDLRDRWNAWCNDCLRQSKKEKRNENKSYRDIQNRRRKYFNLKLRIEMFSQYGQECKCCGEKNLLFLTIDHKDSDGRNERKKFGARWLSQLKKRGWPQNGYQILCWNCNCGRAVNGGICPHKTAIVLKLPTTSGSIDGYLPSCPIYSS